MKKISTILFLVFLFLRPALSQESVEYRLMSLRSSDNLDSTHFYYNENNLLISYQLTTPDNPGSLDVIDSLYYDERNNISSIHSYQKINNAWFHCCIVEYTYDDNNNRLTRSNFNNFGWGFEPQGVYTYTYNENNQLLYFEMSLIGSVYQRCTLTYNENSLLAQEFFEINDSWPNGAAWVNSSKTDYFYDQNNNLTKINYYYWDNGAWSFDNHTDMSYDDAGNCLSRVYYTGTAISDRIIYQYDLTTPIQNVVMPVHPEPFYRDFDQFKNRPLSYSWETVDENGFLVYVCDFNFNYMLTNPTGLGAVLADNGLRVFPNPANGSFNLSLEGQQKIELFDVSGNKVKQLQTSSDFTSVDIHDLPAGLYLLKVFDGKIWHFSKVTAVSEK